MEKSGFGELGLTPTLLQAIDSIGYVNPSPVQENIIPSALEGKDIAACAPTGSGKTAGFGLPLMQLLISQPGAMALVICPARELAKQIEGEFRKFSRFEPNIRGISIYGGNDFEKEANAIARGARWIVGTPGRLLDHIRRGTLSLGNIRLLVMDEADKMLEMGFRDELEQLMQSLPPSRQTMLFSATFPDEVRKLVNVHLKKPFQYGLDSEEETQPDIEKFFVETDEENKVQVVSKLLSKFKLKNAILFCNTREAVSTLYLELNRKGYSVGILHGGLEQADRDRVMLRFRSKAINLLVATDLAARGLDIEDLDAVIHFELPDTPEGFTHRIGRTGRAGKSGLAFTLLSSREKSYIERRQDAEGFDIGSAISGKEIEKTPLSQPARADMECLFIGGGKRDKIRKTDILGAISAETGLKGDEIGRIEVLERYSSAAIRRDAFNPAFEKMKEAKIKGKKFKIERLN